MAGFFKKFQKQIVCLLLALVTLATFWPVVHNGFIEYDDDDYIFENPDVRAGLTWNGFTWAFLGLHAVNYHPLTWLSHMLDCQLFGLNPGAHHLVNVIFHCANAVLLLWLLDSLTGKFWRSAFVAALFALHPLRVESVAWAAERKDVLCAFFFLLALLAYVKCVKRGTRDARPAKTAGRAGENPRLRPRLALFFFLLALLAKPMAVTLPVVLLLLDFWPLRRISSFKLQASNLLVEKWPFFFLSAVFSGITIFAQHGTLPQQPATLPGRLQNLAGDYFAYIGKILWPQDLSFLYLRHEPGAMTRLPAAALVLAAISIFAWLRRRRNPWLLTGWLWFLVMLLPVTAVALNKLAIADRYTYLPGIGFCVMLVWGAAGFAGEISTPAAVKYFSGLAAVAILFFCAMRTREQIGYWKNTQTLAEHALKLDPHNDVAAQILRIYAFEQAHPGVRENHSHGKSGPQTAR